MKFLLLLLVTLLFVKNVVANWDSLDTFKDTLNGYQGAAESAMQATQDLIRNTTSDASSFLSDLDELSIVKEVNALPEGDRCKVQFLDLKTSKNAFKLHFSKLEGPLVKRIAEIKHNFNSLKASISVYKGLADGKWWACKIAGTECLEETKIWLEEKIQILMCRIVKDCAKKRLVKRKVSLTCAHSQYEYEGSCYYIDSYTCNGNCYYNEHYRNGRTYCRDEPSEGCSKYCVGGFHCRNLKCIEIKEVCNDVDDCGDGSDESGCEEREFRGNCTLEEGKFLCGDKKKCLELSSTCDGVSDCADGSDETEACAGGDCGAECRAAGGVCLRTPRGQLCLSHCPPGTSETPGGCEAGPALPPHALADLLDDLPRMTSRYLASYRLLQARLVDELTNALARVADCRGGSLGDLRRLSGYITSTTPPAAYPIVTINYSAEEIPPVSEENQL